MLYVDSFRQKILSTTQAKVIYAHAHSVTSVFYLFAQSAFKRWFTGEMFASFIKKRCRFDVRTSSTATAERPRNARSGDIKGGGSLLG